MITTFAILAGGESRRMGTDKAALEIDGVSLLQRTIKAVQGPGQRALVVGRPRPEGWPAEYAEFVEDAEPGLGPLGGLRTALRSRGTIFALACDMPLLTANAVQWLRGQSGRSGEHGLIVVNGSQWEPLFSVYRAGCLPLVEARLADGKRSLHGFIEAGAFAFAEAPDWVGVQLANVNTPEEWQETSYGSKTTLPMV